MKAIAMLALVASVPSLVAANVGPNVFDVNVSSEGVKHCTDRGGCSCDCGWASSSTCQHDDGSCCWGCCCSGGPSPPPSPSPSPRPTPSPSPSPQPSPCGTPVECHGALKRSGNRIVDKSGKNVQLNGLSMFWSNWAGSFWNGDVVKYLASQWNISLVRCAVGVSNDAGNVPGGYLDDPNGNKAKLFAVVDAAIEAGIYAIIDWHVEGRCNADQSKPFFSEMAQKYGQQPNIIWETCNEPHGWAWGAGLKSYHEQVIPTIRQYSSNLIVAGTNTWSQDVDEASRDQLADTNVAYTLHFYSSMHKQANRDKASAAMSNGAAVFVTEWGVEQNHEGHSETETWLSYLRQNSISNSMWGIYDKDSEAWAIVHSGASSHGGWSNGDLTDTGRFAKAYLLQQAGGGPGQTNETLTNQTLTGPGQTNQTLTNQTLANQTFNQPRKPGVGSAQANQTLTQILV